MITLPIESMNESADDGDIMFRILMDPQPIVQTQGTDNHGCWECDDGSFSWWGRESDGYHRKHSSPHRCPFGKDGDNVVFGDSQGTISSITIASVVEDRLPQDVGPRGTYHWCIWVTPSNYRELN